MNNNSIDPMLTTSEVAYLLNVHINTVRRWSNLGILQAYRLGSRGDRRFRREDITSFFAKDGGGNGKDRPRQASSSSKTDSR